MKYTYKGVRVLELSISQAQAQFTKLLNKTSIIVDKKSNIKKAVIIPYEEYRALLKRAAKTSSTKDDGFEKFIGMLDSNFKTEDEKYNRIVN